MRCFVCCAVPNQFLAFSRSDSEIEFTTADGKTPGPVPGLVRLTDISDASQLDYDASSQDLIWADTINNVITADGIQGGHRRGLVSGFTDLATVAVDWVSSLLYFSDHTQEIVGVARLDGQYAKILELAGKLDVTSIALDPENGLEIYLKLIPRKRRKRQRVCYCRFMYWADQKSRSSDDNARIVKGYMNGQEQKTLEKMSKGFGWSDGPAKSLVLDLQKQTIYWAQKRWTLVSGSSWKVHLSQLF